LPKSPTDLKIADLLKTVETPGASSGMSTEQRKEELKKVWTEKKDDFSVTHYGGRHKWDMAMSNVD
jgi:hypothetical protein